MFIVIFIFNIFFFTLLLLQNKFANPNIIIIERLKFLEKETYPFPELVGYVAS